MAKKLKIHSEDELVHDVIKKFDQRSAVGYAKYGSTLRGDVDNIHRWLNDVQEELMDAILYLQKCKEMTTEMLEEKLIEEYDDRQLGETRSVYPGDVWVTTTSAD